MDTTRPPIVNFTLSNGQPAFLEVSIDLTAHGEEGIGPLERYVTIRTKGGRRVEFTLTATVVP